MKTKYLIIYKDNPISYFRHFKNDIFIKTKANALEK